MPSEVKQLQKQLADERKAVRLLSIAVVDAWDWVPGSFWKRDANASPARPGPSVLAVQRNKIAAEAVAHAKRTKK